MRVLVLVTAILASAVALPAPVEQSGARTVCPSFLQRCECTTVSSGVLVVCKSFTDPAQLRSTMHDLRGFNIQQFTMSKSDIAIENGDFAGVSLYSMDVDSSSLRVINDGFLVDSSNKLQVLKFQNSEVTFNVKNLKNTKLSTLWFNNCTITDYNPAFFKGLSVETLRIVRSPKLSSIASKLQNMEKYSHTSSGLTVLDRSMLPENAGSIKELDFSGNSIVSVSDTFLDGLEKLSRLDLSSNKLETLSEGTFKHFNGSLYLTNNPLKCNTSLHWLAKRLTEGSFKQPHRYTCINDEGRTQSIRDLGKTKSTFDCDEEETT